MHPWSVLVAAQRLLASAWHQVLAALCLAGALASAQAAPTLSVAPGVGVAGYIPLALFGVAPLAGFTDDSMQNFSVPSFVYAGRSWGALGISSNGYLVVGGAGPADNQALNRSLPDSAAPHNILAPFWTDLDIAQGGEISIATLTDGVSSWIVVDWNLLANKDGSGANSFEVWIGINGVEDIVFEYGAIAGTQPGSAGLLTVGAQDETGTVGASRYHNGSGTAPVVGQSLRVSARDLPVVAEVPEPAAMALVGLGLLSIAVARRRRHA